MSSKSPQIPYSSVSYHIWQYGFAAGCASPPHTPFSGCFTALCQVVPLTVTEVWELLDELRIPSENFLEMLPFVLHHWCDGQKFFHQRSWPWGFSKGQWDNCDPSQTSPKELSKKSSATSFPIPFPSYFSLSSAIASSFSNCSLVFSEISLERECHLNKPWNKSCLLHLQRWWKP